MLYSGRRSCRCSFAYSSTILSVTPWAKSRNLAPVGDPISSLHYCTAAEEAAFLGEAADFSGFEGGRILNRVVITESPDRVIELIRDHVFDKFSPGSASPVHARLAQRSLRARRPLALLLAFLHGSLLLGHVVDDARSDRVWRGGRIVHAAAKDR